MRKTVAIHLPFKPDSWNTAALPDPVALLHDAHSGKTLMGIGAVHSICCSDNLAFETWQHFVDSKQDWLFGFLSYDLKNQIEKLSSNNFDGVGMPMLHFFQPAIVVEIEDERCEAHIHPESQLSLADLFEVFAAKPPGSQNTNTPLVVARMARDEYLSKLDQLHRHIHRGNIYEINFCHEFYAEDAQLEPLHVWASLLEKTKAPFSAFYKLGDRYLMSGSPERFLKKSGNKLISQPIKGTIRRGKTAEEDTALQRQLANDPKERSENVMIVDLVRNDLSKSATKGSVQVEELFGIHTFETVHQMISTVSCQLRPDVHVCDAIKAAFPMGSMTGAPKIRAMELAEEYETTKRGLYSGAVGYINPSGDCDFNVVIRSMLYNAESQYLSMMVGGAITGNSIAEKEYEECLLKAQALFDALGASASIDSAS